MKKKFGISHRELRFLDRYKEEFDKTYGNYDENGNYQIHLHQQSDFQSIWIPSIVQYRLLFQSSYHNSSDVWHEFINEAYADSDDYSLDDFNEDTLNLDLSLQDDGSLDKNGKSLKSKSISSFEPQTDYATKLEDNAQLDMSVPSASAGSPQSLRHKSNNRRGSFSRSRERNDH